MQTIKPYVAAVSIVLQETQTTEIVPTVDTTFWPTATTV